MKIIDLHCDTFMKLYKNDDKYNFDENNLHIDLNKLLEGRSLAQFFAMYIYKKLNYKEYGFKSLFDYTVSMIDYFHKVIEKYDTIKYASDLSSLKKNEINSKISAFLSLEEGGVIGKNLDRLDILYNKGIRAITLTWNFPNSIGYPNIKKQYESKGLTSFGREVVKKMNDLGILIDVSHLSDQGFYEVVSLTDYPVAATHSNARKIHKHSRNLTDDMIKKIADIGGIIGVNFCANFLNNKKKSYITDILRHMNHIKNVGGVEVLALGSDFDGISCELELKNYSFMQSLVDKMDDFGFGNEEIEKICFKNAMNTIGNVL